MFVVHETSVLLQENYAPGPLPLGVSVIDASLTLFGIAFSHVAMKHRVQVLRHFDVCIKQCAKSSQRQHAVQINIVAALICALKGRYGLSKRLKVFLLKYFFARILGCQIVF